MNKINSFRGKYYFLSNFYESPVKYLGVTYQNNEAAFQAQKIFNSKLDGYEKQNEFSKLNPSEAKRLGRRVNLRSDWEEVKENIMYEICLAKFTQNEDLKKDLLETGDSYLEEGNSWGDKIWGTVDGLGENKLGKILMRIREEIKTPSCMLYELIEGAVNNDSIIYRPDMALGMKYNKELRCFIWCYKNGVYCTSNVDGTGYKRVILSEDIITDGWRVK